MVIFLPAIIIVVSIHAFAVKDIACNADNQSTRNGIGFQVWKGVGGVNLLCILLRSQLRLRFPEMIAVEFEFCISPSQLMVISYTK
ncbi:hypothetical protein C8R45DRAFT_1004896 [Mycena sanguinolenta]|nr:hypothetical protein C8R45DRAFT_1004896 [Mycena sanguinolenta]